MSQPRFTALRADIQRERDGVAHLVAEVLEWQPRLADWPETVRVRTAGGIVHDFCCGIVRVFRLIAARVDQDLPDGSDWHVQLLRRLATPIEGVRPAVIWPATEQQRDDYLRFRHLLRKIYGFDLDWERCRTLLDPLPAVFSTLGSDLATFDGFLSTLASEV